MSAHLSTEQFEQARTAVRAGTITPELYRWLNTLVYIAQATRTFAPPPVPSGRWDDPDAVSETLHAWLESSLLRGTLLQAFDVCATARGLSKYLETALRNWLVDQTRGRTRPRLLKRSAELLGSSPFRVVSDSVTVMERWWGLEVWESPELFGGSDDDVAAAAWAQGDFPVLRFASSDRADPVLSTPDLERYLTGLLSNVGAALNGRHIDHSFRQRFPHAYYSSPVDIDEVPEAHTNETPETEFAAADAARTAITNMTDRQLKILIDRPDTTLEALAAELKVSRGTIDNEYRRAMTTVKEAAWSESALRQILEIISDLASR